MKQNNVIYTYQVIERLSAHYLFCVSGLLATQTKRIYIGIIIFPMFLSNLRVKSPIPKNIENNIFEGITY